MVKEAAAAAAAKIASSVTVLPAAAVAIALHSIRHKSSSVHGLLLGRCEGGDKKKNGTTTRVVVTDAVPVSHGAPSMPVVETALGLLQQHCKSKDKDDAAAVHIVGWYTAPMLLEDTRPGPVALRMAANLATAATASGEQEPILLVVQNKELAAAFKGTVTAVDSTNQSFVKALVRDFGNQWLDPVTTVMEQPKDVATAIQQAAKQGIMVSDLIDHFEEIASSPAPSSWYPNREVSALIKNVDLKS